MSGIYSSQCNADEAYRRGQHTLLVACTTKVFFIPPTSLAVLLLSIFCVLVPLVVFCCRSPPPLFLVPIGESIPGTKSIHIPRYDNSYVVLEHSMYNHLVGTIGWGNTTCMWYVEVWELQLYFYPSAGGFKKKKKKGVCQFTLHRVAHEGWLLCCYRCVSCRGKFLSATINTRTILLSCLRGDILLHSLALFPLGSLAVWYSASLL